MGIFGISRSEHEARRRIGPDVTRQFPRYPVYDAEEVITCVSCGLVIKAADCTLIRGADEATRSFGGWQVYSYFWKKLKFLLECPRCKTCTTRAPLQDCISGPY